MSVINVTPGSGASVFVYNDTSGYSHPAGVVEFLVGSAPTGVSSSNPLPVAQTGTVTVVNAGTFATQAAQSGSWAVGIKDGAGNALTSLAAGSQRAITVAVVDASGNQVTSFGGGGGGSAFGSAFPATGTAIGFKDSTGANLAAGNLDSSGNLKVLATPTGTYAVSGTVAATQSGTWTVQPGNTANTTPWLASINAGGNTATVTAGNALKVDGSAVTQPISGTVTANAGTGTFAVSAASLPLPTGAATAAKQPALGAAGSAAADVITVQGIASMTPLKVDGSGVTQPVSGSVSLAPSTSGGLATSSTIAANSTNATSVKPSSGQLYGYAIDNTTASAIYVKFYDKATAPVVGTDTPIRRLMIPANGGRERSLPNGLQFANGIAFAITANAADADATAVAAGACLVNIDYK